MISAAASQIIQRLPAPSSSQKSSPSSTRWTFGGEPNLAGLHKSHASALLGLTPSTDAPDSIGCSADAEKQEERLALLSKYLSTKFPSLKQNCSAICHPWHDVHWVDVGEGADWPCLIAFGGISEALLSKCCRAICRLARM